MKIRRLKVELYDETVGLNCLEDIVRLNTIKIFLAYKVCCQDEYALFQQTKKDIGYWGFGKTSSQKEMSEYEEMQWFIRRCLNSGHTSPIEHSCLTFHVSGFSRAGSHQLVRNRIASYTQQSQRAVSMEDMIVTIPPSIETHENPEVPQRFNDTILYLEDAYKYFISQGIPKEDARFISPQACTTALVFTMNFRSLQNFFKERCCNRAQWEIRDLANQMLDLCIKHYPCIFEDAGPKCFEHAECPEGPLICKSPRFIGRESATLRRKSRLRERKEAMAKLSA